MDKPSYPQIVVDLVGQQEKPVACIAVIRRALQRAGHPEQATEFTNQALSEGPDRIFAIARRFVTLKLQ